MSNNEQRTSQRNTRQIYNNLNETKMTKNSAREPQVVRFNKREGKTIAKKIKTTQDDIGVNDNQFTYNSTINKTNQKNQNTKNNNTRKVEFDDSTTGKVPEVKPEESDTPLPITTQHFSDTTLSSALSTAVSGIVPSLDAAPLTDTSDKKNHKRNNKVIYKIFPSSYPNNKGSYVGKEYIQLLKDPSFMDHFDDVDFYMNSLFKNMLNDLTDEKNVDVKGISKKKTPRSILPYFEKVIQFDPTIYTKAVASGGKKSRNRRNTCNHRNTSNHRNTCNHRKTYKKNKNQKRRTYKKKK